MLYWMSGIKQVPSFDPTQLINPHHPNPTLTRESLRITEQGSGLYFWCSSR